LNTAADHAVYEVMRIAFAGALLFVSASAFAMNPGARPGETFTFKFSVGPIEGGRARMAIGKTVAHKGKRVVWVHGQAETTAFVKLLARMDDEYKLAVDTKSLLPLSVSETERGMRQRRINTLVDGRTADIDFWAPEKQERGRRVLPRVARDPLSGLFALRALELPDNQKIDLDVLDGAALWRCALTVHRGQSLRLEDDKEGAPKRNAIRIDGVTTRIDDGGRPVARIAPRKITIWLTDDGDRVLLRLEADTDFGRCALELTSYAAPTQVAVDERVPSLPGIETR
jgi:hypothetical protein